MIVAVQDGQYIKQFKPEAKVLYSTEERVEMIEALRIVDKVLVMSVNPGKAGQMYLPYVGEKLLKLLTLKEDMHFELYWDGACSADKILNFAPKGVRGFVLGTTLLFGKNRPYAEILKDIRGLNIR